MARLATYSSDDVTQASASKVVTSPSDATEAFRGAYEGLASLDHLVERCEDIVRQLEKDSGKLDAEANHPDDVVVDDEDVLDVENPFSFNGGFSPSSTPRQQTPDAVAPDTPLLSPAILTLPDDAPSPDVCPQFEACTKELPGFSSQEMKVKPDESLDGESREEKAKVLSSSSSADYESVSSDCNCEDDENCPHTQHYLPMSDFLKYKPRFTPACRRNDDDDQSASSDSVTFFFERPSHPRVSELIEESRAEQEVVRRVSDANLHSTHRYMQLLWSRAAGDSRAADVTVLQAPDEGGNSPIADKSACDVGDVLNGDSLSQSITAQDQFKTARSDVTGAEFGDVMARSPIDDDHDTLSDVENISDDGDVEQEGVIADDVISLSDSCCDVIDD